MRCPFVWCNVQSTDDISTPKKSRFGTWKWGPPWKRRDSCLETIMTSGSSLLLFRGVWLDWTWVERGFTIQDLICSLNIQHSKFVSYTFLLCVHFGVKIHPFDGESLEVGGQNVPFIRWQRPWHPMVLLLGRSHVELNLVARWRRWWRIFAPPRSPTWSWKSEYQIEYSP